jgi:glycosyltransferase involved in cell wall biosynthesis
MKVLFLTQTSELGPSSRYRVYQLAPLLQKLGIECEISPALDSELYQRIYLELGGRGSRRAVSGTIWRRRRADLQRLDEFNVVFVQKGVFPGLHAGFERQIAARKPLVFDLDDAVWLRRRGGSMLLRVLHREKTVQDVLRCAAAVIAGNAYLAEYASRFNSNVTVVPSTVDLSRYPAAPAHPQAAPPVVGWIGSSTTLSYLKPLKPVFESAGVTPRVIASGNPARLGFRVDFRPWRLETEIRELTQLGIGLAPLPDTAWERGKCGVKLLQYMACGLPVVASPVGVNAEIVVHGVSGFLARDTGEWRNALVELMENPKLRRQLGAAGHETVRKRFNVQRAADEVASVLRRLA